MVKVSDSETSKPSVPRWCSCRYGLVLLGMTGGIVLSITRYNMSVAIICMTVEPAQNLDNGTTTNYSGHGGISIFAPQLHNDNNDCPNSATDGNSSSSQQSGEFVWDRGLRSYILSAYFFGYTAAQIPGGWLASRFGAKWSIFWGFSLATICTLLTPMCAAVSPYLLIAIRATLGIGQGIYYPSWLQLWSVWAPPGERSQLITFALTGTNLGSVFSYFVSGLFCDQLGWRWIFYIYGIVAALWCVCWVIFAFDSPGKHPRITEAEKTYIETSLGNNEKTSYKSTRTPWIKILTSPPVLAGIFTYSCHAFTFYVSATSLPQYMADVLKFNITKNGLYNTLPNLCKWVFSIVASIGADLLISRQILRVVTVRKSADALSKFLAIPFLVGVGYLDCHEWRAAVAFLCIAETVNGLQRSGSVPNIVDIAPRYAGVIMGLSGAFANINGFLAPIVVGLLTPNGTQEEWKVVFYVGSAVYAAGAIVFVIFGSGDVQKWAKDEISKEAATEQDSTKKSQPDVEKY